MLLQKSWNLALVAVLVLISSIVSTALADGPSRSVRVDSQGSSSWNEIDFRLPSIEMRGYALSDFRSYDKLVLVGLNSQDCQQGDLESRLVSFQKKYRNSKDWKIVALDVAARADRNKVAQRLRGQGLAYLFDVYHQNASSYDLKKLGDFVLLNGADGVQLARGNLFDSNENGKADANLVKFREAWLSAPKQSGASEPLSADCALKDLNEFTGKFQEDFLKPFAKACMSCHVSTQVHDYFTSLDQVLGWRAMSLKTIRLMRMPGRFDPYYNSNSDPYNPTVEDLRKIVQWLGKPPQITDQMRRAFGNMRERRIRAIENPQPVLPILQTIEMKSEVELPAVGPSSYINTFVGEPLKDDINVQGFYLRTNLNAVHHTTIFAFDPKKIDANEFARSANMDFHLRARTLQKFFGEDVLKSIDGFLDGRKLAFNLVNEPVLATFSRRQGRLVYPLDSALTIKKGMQFAIQMHMEPSGKKERVRMSFDVLGRASDSKFRQIRRWSVEPHKSFRIPAGKESYIARAIANVDKPILLKSLSVHTHYRGIAARIDVRRPDGKIETLASIPFMQFKMDRVLMLPGDGVRLEAGSSLISEIEYDNSSRHPANPDPNETVTLGGSTDANEMHYPRYLYVEL